MLQGAGTGKLSANSVARRVTLHVLAAVGSQTPGQKPVQLRKPTPPHRTHYVEEQNQPAVSEDDAYSMFALTDQSSRPYIMKVNVCGEDLDMEIDTGASWSILSEETFQNLRRSGHDLSLDRCEVQLRTYTGESLPVLGKIVVHAVVGQRDKQLPTLPSTSF